MLLQSCALARAKGTLLNYWNVPNSLPGSAGVPPAPSLAQPRPSPPLGSTGNGAMALLRPGRCGSRRQGGCLWHPLKLSGGQRDSMRAGRPRSRARPSPPCRADHSRKNGRSLMKPEPRGHAGRDGPASGTQRPKCGSLVRDARAPGQGRSRRQGGCLRHRTEAQRRPMGQHAGGTPALPGKAGPADRVAACGIALKLSGSQRDSMRAGRPRSRARQKPGTWFTPFINALFIPFVVLRG